jgi:hypothetical protein
MIMQPCDLYKTQLTANDIVLIGAISPDGDEIQVARYARQIGAPDATLPTPRSWES